MKNLMIKGRIALAIVSGIIFFGFLVMAFEDRLPVQLAQANQDLNLPTIEEKVEESVKNESISKVEVPDERVSKIKKYLSKRNAPLAKYAKELVHYADKYKIDYRLVAAISVIESGGGINTFRKYNAWGWGKSGFDNWVDGIETVSKGLAKYYARGLTTPKLISTSYCPPSANDWARKVQYVMNQIAAQ
ncbi:MAG: hypothetical protein PHE21_01065 [Candidatus Dojkabacteria bacterium]|nr:hypothetical protein [Candidatus Dojkabacteria bacterium]